jgi:hypothetical protein
LAPNENTLGATGRQRISNLTKTKDFQRAGDRTRTGDVQLEEVGDAKEWTAKSSSFNGNGQLGFLGTNDLAHIRAATVPSSPPTLPSTFIALPAR